MTTTLEDLIAALPPSLEPEFVMVSPDEPIRLAVGSIELFRDSRLLGNLEPTFPI